MPQITTDVMQVGQSNDNNKYYYYYYYYYYVKDEVFSLIIKQYPVKDHGAVKI
jgi:hypothetical protein